MHLTCYKKLGACELGWLSLRVADKHRPFFFNSNEQCLFGVLKKK